MQSESSTLIRSTFRALGSLWFAAMLLVLLLVAMACATVFESMHGTEQALANFYFSWWFEILLTLVGVNVLAAVLARLPLNRKQYGFALTHLSLLVIFAGALVTQRFGVDGSVGILEGGSVNEFTDRREETVTVESRSDQGRKTVKVGDALYGHFDPTDIRRAPAITLGDLRGEIVRYLPDSAWQRRVLNDNPEPQAAIEVSFSRDGQAAPEWIFPGRSVQFGGQRGPRVSFRPVTDAAALALLLDPAPGGESDSVGKVRIAYSGRVYEFPVEEGLADAVPLGDTGYTARVLRHLRHALVGPENKIINDPDRPVNPYIEVEVSGPAGTAVHKAFSRFPDFGSMHGGSGAEDLKLTFVAGTATNAPLTPIEVLLGPGGELVARFSRGADDIVTRELGIGTVVDTPWPGFKFSVRQRLDRARVEDTLEPVEPVRTGREPAILMHFTTSSSPGAGPAEGGSEPPTELWVRKYEPVQVTVAGQTYDVVYSDRTIPLDFSLKLERFRLGTYPGGRRPRSYESQVTITEPKTGRTQSRVISMNHPTSFGGYTFYQSSYRQGGGQTASFLSVARDPGQPIVFAGYIGLMAGMVWVLVIRMTDKKRTAGLNSAGS